MSRPTLVKVNLDAADIAQRITALRMDVRGTQHPLEASWRAGRLHVLVRWHRKKKEAQ